MTDFEIAKWIKSATLTAAAEGIAYSWDEGYVVGKLRELPAEIMSLESFRPVDVNRLTADQLDELGFGLWDEGDPLRLIPLWLTPYLADEFEGCDIFGMHGTFKRDAIDKDHRGGFIAVGVIPG